MYEGMDWITSMGRQQPNRFFRSGLGFVSGSFGWTWFSLGCTNFWDLFLFVRNFVCVGSVLGDMLALSVDGWVGTADLQPVATT